MKKLLKRALEYLDTSLKRQLIFYLMLGVLIPLTVITSLLFMKAREEMKNQAVKNISQRAALIAGNVDELIYNVRSISDKFAYDVEIENVIEKKYKTNSMEKLNDTYRLKGYFLKTDLLNPAERISALYSKNSEIINFVEPSNDKGNIEQKLLKLGVVDQSSLSTFRWYPLQENFLNTERETDLRKKLVVIGVRRILHPFTGSFLYTQLFAIEEEKIWNVYKDSAKEMQGTVYIADKEGNLISSFDKKQLESKIVPKEIWEKTNATTNKKMEISYNGVTYITSTETLKNVEWNVISMVPVGVVTAPVDRLFKGIITIMACCVFACVTIITYISNRFLQPVDVLNNSMREVHGGNLEAYVKPESYHGEIKSMMYYYNYMLVSINQFIEERVENEKKKKQLELEVLMGQVNPHFLYNTLENIVWKSNEVGCPDIGRLAASLGRLYRLSISNGEIIIPIKQEIEHVMAYVNIQKNRYKDRVHFDLQVNYEDVWDYSMIKLTLQPVIENCFMYAIENINHTLKIRLKIRAKEDVIRFSIIDNGQGLTKEQLEEVRLQIARGPSKIQEESKRKRKGTGIGLYSVKERIAIYTGFQDGVVIYSKKEVGTIVTITFRKIIKKDNYQP